MKKYKVAIYLRISKEDDKNFESESIINQKIMLTEFVNSREDLELVSIRIDDGYSGGNFERPAFKKLMEDIKDKKVNCIIVKDFSRFGRNFIEVGKYIEEIFPFMNVRFISINDGYDSIKNNTKDNLIVPFKNLINDAYLRDISLKVRSQLDIKRKNGEFIGSFATYGYLKDPNNKNKLIVDEYASKIVKEIFKLKLEGFTNNKIAQILNDKGILCPMEYKKYIGLNFKTGFKSKTMALWNHNTIIRILKNPIYIGVLEQGKTTTLNYRVKTKVENPKEKWLVCKDNHQPIIDKDIFENIQKIMLSDTRVAPNNEKVFLLSGILYCGDCKRSLIRKNYGTKEKRYIYYVCSGAIKKTGCTKYAIRDKIIEDIIFKTIKIHIKTLLDIKKLFNLIKQLPYKEPEVINLNVNIDNQKEEIEKLEERKFKIYEDYKDKILNKDEYNRYTFIIDKKIEILKKSIKDFETKFNNLVNRNEQEQQFVQSLEKYKEIEKIDRKLIIFLIEKIYIYKNSRIYIKFKFNKQYK